MASGFGLHCEDFSASGVKIAYSSLLVWFLDKPVSCAALSSIASLGFRYIESSSGF